jgi:hypothetical protein
MLTVAFYNLTILKKPPKIDVDDVYGGTRLCFTDNAGDELAIVLKLDTLAQIFMQIFKAGDKGIRALKAFQEILEKK